MEEKLFQKKDIKLLTIAKKIEEFSKISNHISEDDPQYTIDPEEQMEELNNPYIDFYNEKGEEEEY